MVRELKLYVGNIGVKIKVNVGASLRDVASIVLYVEKPDGSTAVTWAAFVLGDEANGQVAYITVSGDLNVAGIYRLYALVTYNDGGTFYGDRSYFRVWDPSDG